MLNLEQFSINRAAASIVNREVIQDLKHALPQLTIFSTHIFLLFPFPHLNGESLSSDISRSCEIFCFLFAAERFLISHIKLGFANYPHNFVRFDFYNVASKTFFSTGNFSSIGSSVISG